MKIEGRTVLVTGANRGLGRHFIDALLARGAGQVYAAARDPDSLTSVVTDHGDILVRSTHRAKNPRLSHVGVLILIDEDVVV